MDLKEAEDIKKRWKEYTEELYKKDLQDPDNHDGVITRLESDTTEATWYAFTYSLRMAILLHIKLLPSFLEI